VRRRGTKHAASPAKQIPARIGPAEFSTLGAMIACAATQDLDPLMPSRADRAAAGRPADPQPLRHDTDPLFRQAGIDLDEG
jgi:hypothetical protein